VDGNQGKISYTTYKGNNKPTIRLAQGDSLCSHLTHAKMPFIFSFTKSENRRAEQVLPGVGTSGRGRI
jgi:hypothetical protein